MEKKPSAKFKDVAKFGGNEHVTTTKLDGHSHEVESIESQSKTSLESDLGVGNAAIIRMFEFGADPQAFKERPPTKQDLFNAHQKGIEMLLWRDGLKVIPRVNPRIQINEKGTKYRIWIGAAPMKGHILKEQPQTLSQIVHG